ncbi:MAG: MotA/TolQ/ExbB proton channel family protein [Rhodospirillaceae bacterium]
MLYRYVLFAHFLLVNVIALGFAAAAYLQGWLDPIVNAPLIELSGVIALVFLYGVLLAAYRVWQTSREATDVQDGQVRRGTPSGDYVAALTGDDVRAREKAEQVLRLRLSNRIVAVRHFANALVFLGLIGTVIGFIIALSGVDPNAASDAAKVGAMVATLISGMSVALNTTLVGSILYVWLIVNHRILSTGTVNLLTQSMQMDAGAATLAGDLGYAPPRAAQ